MKEECSLRVFSLRFFKQCPDVILRQKLVIYPGRFSNQPSTSAWYQPTDRVARLPSLTGAGKSPMHQSVLQVLRI